MSRYYTLLRMIFQYLQHTCGCDIIVNYLNELELCLLIELFSNEKEISSLWIMLLNVVDGYFILMSSFYVVSYFRFLFLSLMWAQNDIRNFRVLIMKTATFLIRHRLRRISRKIIISCNRNRKTKKS